MKNIELKVRIGDLEAKEQVARKLGATFQWRRKQIDTYFQTTSGRLKLRKVEGETAQLIGYFRPDAPELRESRYEIVPIAEAEKLRTVLAETLGVLVVVEKIRTLYLYRNIRIHLDQVKDLGGFLEFEGVLSAEDQEAETRKKLAFLEREFQIDPAQKIALSYSDLLLQKRETR